MSIPDTSSGIMKRPTPLPSLVRAMLDGVERDVTVAHRIGGMHSALGALNSRTRYRVTALCPLVPGPLAQVSIYDRDDPGGHLDASLREVCSVALVISEDFNAARATGADEPTAPAARIATDAFASRTGALVYTLDGGVWGILLHYDLRLRIATLRERMILDHLGRRFSTIFPRDVAGMSQDSVARGTLVGQVGSVFA